MDYLPLFHCLQQRPVLLVGGGSVALRKARLLSRAGGILHVIAPKIHPQLLQLLEQHSGRYTLRVWQPGDCGGHVLVVAATTDNEVNRQIVAEADGQGIPVNVVETPSLCSVIFPAIVDRSPLLVAGSDPPGAGTTGNAVAGSLRPVGAVGAKISECGQAAV